VGTKDYTSISPSAKSLLLMKGFTDIPYAKETAALMQGSEVFDLNFDDKDFWFWVRVIHFENRYKSIDRLLKQTDSRNILELSSGYSLRGLDLCVNDANVRYVDTDLPEVVVVKKQMIAELQLDKAAKGTFELVALNALDEAAFDNVVRRFGDGPLTVVNEGLLMYLNTDEKKQLCRTIHRVLKQRGGCWITADMYVKVPAEMSNRVPRRKGESDFFEQHRIDENKFESYDAARVFFEEQGFEVATEDVPRYDQLSAMPHLLKLLPEEARNGPPPKIQATWMLKAR